MATRRYARAIIERRNIDFSEWMDELRDQNEGAVPKDFVHRTAKTILRKCDPKQYLLSHATIVASVDTFSPKNVKTGRLMNRGCQVDVRWPEFRIKPDCHPIVNNNGDAWERSLLLSTYRTFIGAHNYLEHIQLPELSKGFIVDAIARDLGKSCYIDILVATDRKHNQLVSDILSGAITGLSMGCHLPGTQVYLDDGSPINIEDVRPEMRVLSQKGNSCRVDNLQIRQNRWNVRRVKTVGLFPIESTDNHRYYFVRSDSVERVREKNARGSRKASMVVRKDYPFEYKELRELRVGDFLATPIQQEIIQPDVNLSGARLLGLWIGDGWKFENKHDSTIGIGLCMDESWPEIVEDAEKIINQISWAHGEMRIAVGGQTPKTVSRSSRRNAAYLLSSSRAARSIIDLHTDGRRALTKTIGRSIMCWPRDHQLAFLGGLIDSDGCVSTTKRGSKQIHISTRNLKLAHQYYQLLARCGVISCLNKATRKGTKLLPKSAGIDYQIRLRNDDVKKIPSLKVQSVASDLHSNDVGLNDRWLTDKYLYTRVTKIEDFPYEGMVYDLQVDKDHSYIANGVGVSNCISLFTTCTKCGNVAADDSQLCPCVLYDGKLSQFTDESGSESVLAELIGHVSVPNSNQFIEASWVRNPAFRGAVRRNFLNSDPSPQLASMMQNARVLNVKRTQVPEMEGTKKAASYRRAVEQQDAPADDAQDDLFADQGQAGGADQGGQSGQDEGVQEQGGQSQDGQSTSPSAPAEPKRDKVDDLLDKITEQFLTTVSDKLADKLTPKPEDVGSVKPSPVNLESSNDNLVKSSVDFNRVLRKKFATQPRLMTWASRVYKIVHEGGQASIKLAGLRPRDLIVLSWIEDRCRNRINPSNLYKVSLQVGPMNNFASPVAFMASCAMKLGRTPTPRERKFFEIKGRIASFAN